MEFHYKQFEKANTFFRVCICLVLIGLVSCNKKQKITDLSEANIKGKVKTILEESYACKMMLEKPTKTSLDGRVTYEYNQDGNYLSEISISSLGEIKSKSSYNYNNDNQKVEVHYFRGGDLDTSTFIYSYFYNKKGLIERIERRRRTYVSTSEYEYDNLNRLIAIKTHTMEKPYSPDISDFVPEFENTFSIEKSQYNDKGRISKCEVYVSNYTSNPTNIQKYITYEYDNNSNLIAETHFDYVGKISERITSQYIGKQKVQEEDYFSQEYRTNSTFDEHGNIISKIVSGSPGQTEYNEYSYDSEGNWIQKVEFDGSKQPRTITERKIIYY